MYILMPFRLCNHPDLLLPASQAAYDTRDEPLGELAMLAQPVFPEGYVRGQGEHSGITHLLVGFHARMTATVVTLWRLKGGVRSCSVSRDHPSL